MNRKAIIVLAGLGVAGAAVAVLAMRQSHGSNPNVDRAKELLSVDEPDAAVRELKIAVKQDPKDIDAKAVLLLAIERKEKSLVGWYEVQQMLDRIRDVCDKPELASLDKTKELKKLAIRARQELYEKGIDTKSTEEVTELTNLAAAYSFGNADGDERDGAAFVLALRGRADALQYMVDRLKSDKATRVPDMLFELGDRATPALLSTIEDRESLGRGKALDVVSRIELRTAAREWAESDAGLRGIGPDDLPSDLAAELTDAPASTRVTRDELAYGLQLHGKAPSMRMWNVSMTDDGTRRLLIVQGFATATHELVARYFFFENGKVSMLRLQASDQVGLRLAKEGPITDVSFDALNNKMSIAQLGRGQSRATREIAKPHYDAGDRVRVRSINVNGSIRGIDEFGLLLVELDEPRQGMRQMSLTPDAIRFLEPYIVDRVVRRTYRASIEPAVLKLASEVEDATAAAMDKMAEFKDRMCKCTDKSCADRVTDDMTKWSQVLAKDSIRDVKVSDQDTKRMTEITEEFTKCATRAMVASRG